MSTFDKWATFASATAVKVPDEVVVYKAVYSQSGNEEILTLSDAGKVIPANTGVLLMTPDASKTYGFAAATAQEIEDAADAFEGNSLVGCATRTDISSLANEYDIFCLRRSDLFGQSAFFLYSGQYIPAGKAYLKLEKDPSQPNNGAQRRVRFIFDATTDLEATGADSIEATKFMENGQLFIRRGEAVYNLQGMRVQ